MKLITALSLLLIPVSLTAATLEVGSPLVLTLNDQHDVPHSVQDETRVLIFSAERDMSSQVETALEGETAETLAAAGVLYVADISAMPGMVTRLIALPKMRKRPYPMLLGRESEETAMLPREPANVTLIELNGGQIEAIRFIPDAPSLRIALGLAPAQ
ncbi:hypothetical protein CKO25_05120 [Thiocapsa imhoffii]|uniref:Copper chaperone PCu(A)C n=1 Tax=Thiocapsa imhoffii TaxID=382777 RepID=A0A9X1B8F7_9GAMM|nr:hypothetical protein [Thiocapsa imhoffii]MBK1644045.1 hypothetical protein [Thiocapsa imhoffii]